MISFRNWPTSKLTRSKCPSVRDKRGPTVSRDKENIVCTPNTMSALYSFSAAGPRRDYGDRQLLTTAFFSMFSLFPPNILNSIAVASIGTQFPASERAFKNFRKFSLSRKKLEIHSLVTYKNLSKLGHHACYSFPNNFAARFSQLRKLREWLCLQLDREPMLFPNRHPRHIRQSKRGMWSYGGNYKTGEYLFLKIHSWPSEAKAIRLANSGLLMFRNQFLNVDHVPNFYVRLQACCIVHIYMRTIKFKQLSYSRLRYALRRRPTPCSTGYVYTESEIGPKLRTITTTYLTTEQVARCRVRPGKS